MTQQFEISADYGEASRPHIAEWFGHRVFPTVSASPGALDAQSEKRCPFLTSALGEAQLCIKVNSRDPTTTANSEGVCTISATSNNGVRQDWIVCPVRALDDRLLEAMVRRLYRLSDTVDLLLIPAPALADPTRASELVEQLNQAETRVFAYIQNRLGGEIRLQGTPASPQMSYDTAVVELLPHTGSLADGAGYAVRAGRYGIVELQTTDTHGSYAHAVSALRHGLDLHPTAFHAQLAANPEWSRRRVEGPNVSNVFKRTFYQVAFKFRATKLPTSVGCVLALPQPVWDSWRPFLGDPALTRHPDGTWRLLDDTTDDPSDWIYVFDIAESPDPSGGPAITEVKLVIGTNAATLIRAALDVAPANAVQSGGGGDAVAHAITRRLRRFAPTFVAPPPTA